MVFLIYLWKGPITHDPVENMEFALDFRYCGSIEGNTMFFNELGSEARRRLIDVQQRGAALRSAQSELRRRFTGSMAWKTRSNRDYLYRRNGPIDKSLGPRSDATEAINAILHCQFRIEQLLTAQHGCEHYLICDQCI